MQHYQRERLIFAACTLDMINRLTHIKADPHSHLPSAIVFNLRGHFMRKLIFSLLIIFHYIGALVK